MTLAAAALLLLVPLLVGAGICRLLGIAPHSDRLGFLAWAWLAGAMVTALGVLLWVICKKPWPLEIQYALFGLGGLALLLAARRRPAAVWPPPAKSREDWVLYVALAALCALSVDRMSAAACTPVVYSDEANIWAAKAKVLYGAAGFDRELAAESALYVAHPDYPLLNPLLQLAAFELSGRILLVANRLPVQLFVLGLLLATAAALRRVVRPSLAAVLLVVLFAHDTVANLSGMAMSDFMLALGLLVTADAFARFGRTRDRAWWRLAALGAAFTLWAKNEGMMLIPVFAIAASVARVTGAQRAPLLPRPRRETLWLCVPVAIVALHQALVAQQGFVNDLFDPRFSEEPFLGRLVSGLGERALPTLEFLLTRVLFAPANRLLLALFLGLVLLFPRRLWNGEIAVVALTVLLGLSAYQLVFVASPHDLGWHLNTASARVAFHLVPLATLGLAAGLAELYPRVAARAADSQRDGTTAPRDEGIRT